MVVFGLMFNKMCDTTSKEYSLTTKRWNAVVVKEPTSGMSLYAKALFAMISRLMFNSMSVRLPYRLTSARRPHIQFDLCFQECFGHHILRPDCKQLSIFSFPAAFPVHTVKPVQPASSILDGRNPIITRVVAS